MKAHRTITRYALVLLIALAAAGCDDVKAPPAGQGDLLPAENYPRIVALDTLSQHLRFETPVVERATDTRPMRLAVPVRSIEDRYPVAIQYRFEFYDASGRRLSDSGWRYEELTPRVQTQLTAGAMRTGASDWRLIVRSAR